MKLDTIDDILETLDELGYPVKLSELARVIEWHLPRKCLVQTLTDAPYSAGSREILDTALLRARTELRGEDRRIPYRSNPVVRHHFDIGGPPPTVRQSPVTFVPVFGLREDELHGF